jgi:hypothetical protein
VCRKTFEFNPYAAKRKTCGEPCQKERTRQRYAEKWLREKADPRRSKKRFDGYKPQERLELPPPTPRQAEKMWDTLWGMLFTTEEQVKLVFAESSRLGTGLTFKQGEVGL